MFEQKKLKFKQKKKNFNFKKLNKLKKTGNQNQIIKKNKKY